MPIYLVRWPDLSAALVRAASEEELGDILDELANSEGAVCSEYDGPLFLEFSLPVRVELAKQPTPGTPIAPDDISVHDVAELFDGSLRVSIPSCDTAMEMEEAVERTAFPHLHEARRRLDREPTEDELRTAVLDDLTVLTRASWRRAGLQRSSDPVDALAAAVDAPARLIRQWIDEDKDRGDKEED